MCEFVGYYDFFGVGGVVKVCGEVDYWFDDGVFYVGVVFYVVYNNFVDVYFDVDVNGNFKCVMFVGVCDCVLNGEYVFECFGFLFFVFEDCEYGVFYVFVDWVVKLFD